MRIKGVVSRIFCSKPSGFKILVLEVNISQQIPQKYINPEFPASVSAAGVMKEADIGYVVEIDGEWEHRDSGRFWPWQVKVTGCTVCVFETPQLLAEIIGGIEEIGLKKAQKMVSFYGLEIVQLLEEGSSCLQPWESKEGQMKRAGEKLKELRTNADLKAFLLPYGVSEQEALHIQETFGREALTKIKNNPYLPCRERLISFKICDKIGMDLGIPRTDSRRVEAVFSYVLKERAGGKGHCYLPVGQLLTECNAFLKENAGAPGSFTRTLIDENTESLAKEERIVVDQGRVYSVERYRNERAIAEILKRRLNIRSPYADVEDSVILQYIEGVQKEFGFEPEPLQEAAVLMAVKQQTSILTGGPGCGKTSTLKTIIGVLHKLDIRLKRKTTEVALAAPTGMAAKRLVNSTGQEAKTIHKLLEYHPDAPFQMHCEDNPIAAGYVILDETSMMDIDITAMLLKAVRDTTQVLFVGDTDQLPSIGPGEVLADLIASGLFQIIRLKRSFRHGSRRHILENAAKIIQGEISLDIRHSDFQFYEVPDLPEDKECRRLLWKLKRVFFEEYAAMGRNCEMVQVLSPMRVKTLVSADQMNAQLQNLINAQVGFVDELRCGTIRFRRNDRVMQISNNYEKTVFNGDMGVIVQASEKAGKLLVDFNGTLVEYKRAELEQLKHCYAITIHKSQGAEYPVVIIPITGYHSTMLMRNLLYTGVTRARQKLILIGDKNALAYAIQNTQGLKRNTALLEELTESRRNAA